MRAKTAVEWSPECPHAWLRPRSTSHATITTDSPGHARRVAFLHPRSIADAGFLNRQDAKTRRKRRRGVVPGWEGGGKEGKVIPARARCNLHAALVFQSFGLSAFQSFRRPMPSVPPEPVPGFLANRASPLPILAPPRLGGSKSPTTTTDRGPKSVPHKVAKARRRCQALSLLRGFAPSRLLLRPLRIMRNNHLPHLRSIADAGLLNRQGAKTRRKRRGGVAPGSEGGGKAEKSFRREPLRFVCRLGLSVFQSFSLADDRCLQSPPLNWSPASWRTQPLPFRSWRLRVLAVQRTPR